LDVIRGEKTLVVPHHLKDFDATWSAVEKVQGWLARDEAELLYNLAKGTRIGGRVVELGSYCGRSSIVLAAAVLATAVAPVVCVDTFRGSPEHQLGAVCFDPATLINGAIDTYPIFQRNLEHAGLQSLVKAMRMSTLDAALYFVDPIELLFIDADHSYQAVRADLVAWKPKVVEGGLIVLHDFGTWSGVTRAAADLLDEDYDFCAQAGTALALRKPTGR